MTTLPSLALALALTARSPASAGTGIDHTIATVEALTWDGTSQQLAGRHALVSRQRHLGRHRTDQGERPNISDLTTGVRDSQGQLHPMPVLRFDNHTDLDPTRFPLPVPRHGEASFTPVIDGITHRPTEWVAQPETATWAEPTWRWLKAY